MKEIIVPSFVSLQYSLQTSITLPIMGYKICFSSYLQTLPNNSEVEAMSSLCFQEPPSRTLNHCWQQKTHTKQLHNQVTVPKTVLRNVYLALSTLKVLRSHTAQESEFYCQTDLSSHPDCPTFQLCDYGYVSSFLYAKPEYQYLFHRGLVWKSDEIGEDPTQKLLRKYPFLSLFSEKGE